MRSALHTDGHLGSFADRLLAAELPALPLDRRRATVAFVCRRSDQTPGPLRLGVTTLAVGTGVASRYVDADRVVGYLRTARLPFVGELARMVRSLAFAYVWETWPDTKSDGAPGTAPGTAPMAPDTQDIAERG